MQMWQNVHCWMWVKVDWDFIVFFLKLFWVCLKLLKHNFMANRWGNSGNSDRLYFWGLQNPCRWWLQPWNEKMLAPWKKSYDQPRQHIKKQRHYFSNKGPSSQGYGFSSSYVWMWELDCEESWASRIDAFELWCWRRLLRVPRTARRSN